jgi:CheY-like chemotaxis protein
MMVKSVLGEGTVFEPYFPMALGDAQIAAVETIKSQVMHGNKILLVEDQAEVRDMTFMMLARMGYEVDTAANGLEALDILREKPGHHELVLTDQNMPKMTGLELVYQAHEDFPDLIFVILSGYSQEKLQELMAEHPAIHAVIRKPIAQNKLGQILSQVLAAKALKSKLS